VISKAPSSERFVFITLPLIREGVRAPCYLGAASLAEVRG
jgi:hypothetical protein